ncbi:hypothetical protein Q9L58_001900 [Maublancomyces gigas]|uniref:Uncharacterized protein n=1 Tax=Discina gigas TaxID=1032678 RepID=A0ABR3GSV5_9PEZI
MPSFFEIFTWLLKKAGSAAVDQVIYILTHPIDACGDLWDWIKSNKLACFLIASGVFVIAFPPAIGFSAAGPVAGSIAAGLQAAIGNVAAGSLFAILQSLTMTGVFTAIGGWTIGAGITRFLSTYDWKLLAARVVQSYIKDHGQVLRNSLSTIRDMKRILHRIDDLTQALPPDELSQILSLMDDLKRIMARIVDTKRIHDLIQKLDATIALPAPPAEIANLLTELQVASDAFCEHDNGTSLEEEWDECIARAYVKCCKLRRILNSSLVAGTYDPEPGIRRLLRELEDTARKLLEMSFPDGGN